MILPNSYIAIGDTGAALHWIDDVRARFLKDGISLALRRESAQMRLDTYASVFGPDTRYVFTCDEASLEWLANEYTGQYEARVKYLAAALLLGEPIEPEAGSDDGGSPDRIQPKPLPGPAGDSILVTEV